MRPPPQLFERGAALLGNDAALALPQLFEPCADAQRQVIIAGKSYAVARHAMGAHSHSRGSLVTLCRYRSAAMNAGERAVPLEQAAEGAVLARALRDDHGAVLLAQGAVLTSASLAALRRRGIEHCWIVAAPLDDAADKAQAEPCASASWNACLILFRGTPADAAGADLQALLLRYRQGEDA